MSPNTFGLSDETTPAYMLSAERRMLASRLWYVRSLDKYNAISLRIEQITHLLSERDGQDCHCPSCQAESQDSPYIR